MSRVQVISWLLLISCEAPECFIAGHSRPGWMCRFQDLAHVARAAASALYQPSPHCLRGRRLPTPPRYLPPTCAAHDVTGSLCVTQLGISQSVCREDCAHRDSVSRPLHSLSHLTLNAAAGRLRTSPSPKRLICQGSAGLMVAFEVACVVGSPYWKSGVTHARRNLPRPTAWPRYLG